MPFSLHKTIITTALILGAFFPFVATAQSDFNPQFIISDPELQDMSWDSRDIQQFLVNRGSRLASLVTEDASGTLKSAADIIYTAAQTYTINPKFILVTLQKEQSLVTDDTPSQKQLDWATGYAVCDSCSMEDPKVLKFKGFGKQVDNAAGIMRWYYNNSDKGYIKKKDVATTIDSQIITPQSWATAFLYTYTPHIHGNRNFWRIWSTWFEQVYPNGTIALEAGTPNYWLIENGTKRRFATKTALITRADPKNAITVSSVDLGNYKDGKEIAFPNYSLLKTSSATYLVDYDVLRPFASDEVVARLGFNPQELIDVEDSTIAGYTIGSVITASSTAPQGVIYQITDLKNAHYLLKDGTFYPIVDKSIITANYKNLPVEKHTAKDLRAYPVADLPLGFNDGTLLRDVNGNQIYVVDKGKKRAIADDDTFIALGYKKSNILPVALITLLNIPTGEPLFLNASFLTSKEKFLGDNAGQIPDLYAKNNLGSYLVAEYPTGRIVSGKNIDARYSIASLTKLLTGYEAIRQGFSLTGKTTYISSSFASEGTALNFKDGDVITNKNLFYAMYTISNNSAARMVALGTKLDETTFINRMNTRLEQWGADNTSIVDVTGLDENNKSSARDLLKIYTKITDDKEVKAGLGQPSFSFQKVDKKKRSTVQKLENTNLIIKNIPLAKRSYQILATKTGYTIEAKATLVMHIKVKKTKKEYVIVTLYNPDTKNRFLEPHKIAEWISTANLK